MGGRDGLSALFLQFYSKWFLMCLPFVHASYMFVQWVNPASCFPNISLSTRMLSQPLEALNFGYSYFRDSPKIGSGTSRRPPVSEAWGREFHHGRGVSQTQKPQQPLKAPSTWISLEQTHFVLIALHVDHTVLVQTDSECYKSLTTLGKKVVSLQGLGAAVLILGRVYRAPPWWWQTFSRCTGRQDQRRGPHSAMQTTSGSQAAIACEFQGSLPDQAHSE
jgi:hypothetical protein